MQVLTLEKISDALPDGRHTVARAVGAYRADVLEEPLCPLDHVGLVAELVEEHILMLQQLRVLDEAEHLAEECDGLLVELLRVADVGRDDLPEGQVGVAPAKFSAVLLRLDGELAPDGVLGRPNVGVDVVVREPRHGPAVEQFREERLLSTAGGRAGTGT